jgi:DNA-binding MarR family transcriptional regulator
MLTVSKLSRLQKAILMELLEAPKIGERMDRLSWAVIKRLNKPNYVWDVDEHAKRLYEELKLKDPALAWKIKEIVYALHSKRRVQTAAFRAAFSRALRRLERRGLVELLHLRLEKEGDELIWYDYIDKRRKNRVRLTEKGREVALKFLDARSS